MEGCWKDGKRWKEIGKLRFEIWKHCWTYMHTSSQIPDSFIPFSSSPQKPLAPQDPSHFCRAFFCILKHFRWNLLRIHLCAMLLICYQELCPTIQMRSKSLQKTGISDSMIIWTVDFNTPETNSIDIAHQFLVELNFCLWLPKGLTCYATKKISLKSFQSSIAFNNWIFHQNNGLITTAGGYVFCPAIKDWQVQLMIQLSNGPKLEIGSCHHRV